MFHITIDRLFLLIYFYEKDLYHWQSGLLYSIELPYGDRYYKLRKEMVMEQNLVVNLNQLALSQNYIHW